MQSFIENKIKQVLEKPKHTNPEAIQKARRFYELTGGTWVYSPMESAIKKAPTSGADRELALAYIAEDPNLSPSAKLAKAANLYRETSKPFQEILKLYNPLMKTPRISEPNDSSWPEAQVPFPIKGNEKSILSTLSYIARFQTRRRVFELVGIGLRIEESFANQLHKTRRNRM